ncbi:enolase C-terminal domain-like protein [Arthrobacter sp. KFRI-F3372]|uniref:enolase C-terminal domain-like protein n=1 Tax=Pseudarthrobacter oxydans TaxID=1671 RepID=UPI00279ABBEA|nr:enolase C-terminal domain-like protein [Actinomycetes bacterium ARC8]WHP59820.1 enolase C-terminal domain-like protein [Arthrobacter sp. KFRI-F3372]
MQITSITITPVAVKDPPLLNSEGVHQTHALRSVLKVTAENGLVGWGETYGDDVMLQWLDRLSPKIIGVDVFDLNRIAAIVEDELGTSINEAGDSKPAGAGYPMADAASQKTRAAVFSAFEVPCLDIQGKLLGRPVSDLLGGRIRDQVDFSAYLFYKWAEHPSRPYEADIWGEVLTPEQMVAEASRMVDEYGFRSLKLKGGVLPPKEEVATVQALRKALPGLPIRIDPNAAWSVDVAIEVGRQLDGQVDYLEDPVESTADMARVAREVSMPLATNMCVTAFEDIPEAIKEGAPQIILSDHHFWGGLRRSVELDRLCETFGLSLSMHSNTHLGISLAAMTHFGAVARTMTYSCDTHRPWQTEDVLSKATPLPIIDGAVAVPNRPGLGIEVDEDAVAALHEQWKQCGVRTRDDVTPMQDVDPTWTGEVPRFTSY